MYKFNSFYVEPKAEFELTEKIKYEICTAKDNDMIYVYRDGQHYGTFFKDTIAQGIADITKRSKGS